MNAMQIRNRMSGDRRRGSLGNLVRTRSAAPVISGPRDCLGCYPQRIDDPNLPRYVDVTVDGLSWGMPELSEGTIGPFSFYKATPPSNYDSGWECPTWGPTSDGFGGCGDVEINGANVSWRLDTVSPDVLNGTKRAVRVAPDSNKCAWYFSSGRVANIYARGTIIGEEDVYPAVLQVTSVEPEFEVEVHDLVPGVVEGTMVDPGTDDLNVPLCADTGIAIRTFKAFPALPGTDSTLGTVGWKKRRVTYGVFWTVQAVNTAEGYRWRVSGGVSWMWVLKNDGRWTGGTFTVPSPFGVSYTLDRTGQFATTRIYGVADSVTRDAAGVRIVGSNLLVSPSEICADGNSPLPSQLASLTCEAPTEEIVRNLPVTPSSSPPGHRLYLGAGQPNVNFANGLQFTFLSDAAVRCTRDLFSDHSISLTRVVSPLYDAAYEECYGLNLPDTCSLRFSNE